MIGLGDHPKISIYKAYTCRRVEEVFCKKILIPIHLLIPIHFQYFRHIFIIFMAIVDFEQMLMCTLFEGEGSERVWVLYTCENINIFGWPLTQLGHRTIQNYFTYLPASCQHQYVQGVYCVGYLYIIHVLACLAYKKSCKETRQSWIGTNIISFVINQDFVFSLVEYNSVANLEQDFKHL